MQLPLYVPELDNPIFWVDFYKIGHVIQYQKGIQRIVVNFTPRSSRVEGQKDVVFFGGQYLCLHVFQEAFNRHFFSRPIEELRKEYTEFIRATLNVENPKFDHIEALHKLGYLPIKVYAIPEGFSTPLNCPSMVIVNTVDEFFWVPNYLETMISNVLWKPCTSATTARAYRRLFIKYAKDAGETDFSFIDYQGHDFSMRGMSGFDDCILSGMAHLLSFSGTDSAPAIFALRKYYGAELSAGGSVPATEHSVMCAGMEEGEFETFRRLIEDVYPTGIVSIVSDTWDLWRVLTDYIPRLKTLILNRDGKLVIRPDSGDPVKILCGEYGPERDRAAQNVTARDLGVLALLARELGTTRRPGMLPLINKAGAIYGDSITLKRADDILNRVVNHLQLSPYNVVLGIGSFTYEYVTRDTYGFAIKATAVKQDGKWFEIFKKPVTDDGQKNSHKGIPIVYRTEDSTEEKPEYFVTQGGFIDQLDSCAFQKVWEDGKLLITQTSDQIRKRVRA